MKFVFDVAEHESLNLETILQNCCVIILGSLWAGGLGCGRKGGVKFQLLFKVEYFSMFTLNQIRLKSWTGMLLCH